MTPGELRQKYLDFMASHGHAIVPGVPLVPENDPTTLFTGSGMQPMMPYLLGAKHPKGKRVADSQKCFRSQDIEEVGDNRHTTFFEMLGNWSFGDYFKTEQLEWLWQFLTKEVGLNPARLYVSIFAGDKQLDIPKDSQAEKIWQSLGVKNDHLFSYDAAKNWWSRAGEPSKMPVGEPGGPDSEVFFDFGVELRLHEGSRYADEACHPNCDCGRFMEIGNSVFMTYQKQADGRFTELKQKNIDFGGGLERVLAAQANTPDVFLTQAYLPMIKHLEQVSHTKYAAHPVSFRVIADHLKAAIFLAADGVYPGNKEHDYFSRRLVRRAIRYGKKLGIERSFVTELVDVVSQIYGHAFPEIATHQADIQQALTQEEARFQAALTKGLSQLHKLQRLTAHNAFALFQSYGIPLEMSVEEAGQLNLVVQDNIDLDFETERRQHAASSRTASAGKFKGGLADQSQTATKYHTATHLLQAALKKVLGSHVEQKGSNITGERLRFDFTHHQGLTDAQKQAVTNQINTWIKADLPVSKQIMPYQLAVDSGATAFFGEKYPDEVSVFTIGRNPDHDWVSKELCGGPHVKRTGEIGPIKLTKEKSAAAGIRRIYIQLD